jgi:hypothetical protein
MLSFIHLKGSKCIKEGTKKKPYLRLFKWYISTSSLLIWSSKLSPLLPANTIRYTILFNLHAIIVFIANTPSLLTYRESLKGGREAYLSIPRSSNFWSNSGESDAIASSLASCISLSFMACFSAS